MRFIGGILAAAAVAAALVVAGGGGTASGQDAEPPVFTVGYWQDVDSMNLTVGVTVAAYEAWNIQYAGLTDKAAKDFSVQPGLAESWEGSDDGKTWTYKLRPDLKWSDGEPLTADDIVYTINRSREEEWLNHSSVTTNLKAKAIDPTTVEVKSSVPDPKLPVMDVYIVPKHIYEKYDAKADHQVRRAGRRRLGPLPPDRVQEGPVRALRGEPATTGAASRRSPRS